MIMYFAIFTPSNQGGFNGKFPDVPGAITYGLTIEDTIKMAIDSLSVIMVLNRRGKTP
jgi:predicted RNase H-like HicB family nuclease